MRTKIPAAAMSLLVPGWLAAQNATKCDADNGGIKVPAGFCVVVFADSVAGARQLVVAPNGDVIASSRAGVVVLRDANGDGRADSRSAYATGFRSTHVALSGKYLYVEMAPTGRGSGSATTTIVRYAYKPGDEKPSSASDTIVEGIPRTGEHTSRNFAISRDGALYVNFGSASNACQTKEGAKGSPGVNPCPELETRAGIWRFDARKAHQTQAKGEHFARGIRNAVGITMDPTGTKLWTTQHGRDQLGGAMGLWDFDAKYSADNPAEELMQVNRGDDFGWPYCYYSNEEKKLVLAPEYGGDGKKVGQCAGKKSPVAAFPGHWAPNALVVYTGSMFPAKYKNGAFIAFHGSWNRAPEPQAGFNVTFQPLDLATAKATGSYQVFADGFWANPTTGRASAQAGARRPTGLAQGPDGALYVSDDAGGRIWKIVYTGR